MSYTNNYYNYQIGVIFAILIAGLLLLAICIAGIYFGCVVNMRGDKKRHYTAPTIARANAPQRQWQPNEQPGILYNNFSAPRANLSEYATSPHTQAMAPAPVPISAPTGAPTPLYQTQSFGTPSYQQTPPPRPQSQPHSQLYTNRTNTPQQSSPYVVQSSYRPPQPDTIIYQQTPVMTSQWQPQSTPTVPSVLTGNGDGDQGSVIRTAQLDPTVRTAQLFDPNVRTAHLDPSIRAAHLDPSIRAAHLDPSIRAAHLDPSIRAANLDPSIRTAHLDPTIRAAQLLDPSVRIAQLEPVIRSAQLDPSIRTTQLDPNTRITQLETTPPPPPHFPIYHTSSV